MADITTANAYNHTWALIAGQAVTLGNTKLMFLTSAAVFDPTHTTVDAVAGAASPHRAKEVYGFGWPEGGCPVTNVGASVVAGHNGRLAGDQTSRDATGGNIGPGRYILWYDVPTMKPLVLYDLGKDEYAGDSTPFKLTFDKDGTPGTIFLLNSAS